MIKKLSSRTVYENKWMKVREDEVEFKGGTKGIYGVVEKPDFALIVPWVKDEFYLVRQYRYPVKDSFWEFPQGSLEGGADIDPRKLALRELQEETGLVAKKMDKIGYLHEAYGFCNQGFSVFLAGDFEQGSQALEASEAGLEVARFSVSEFEHMVQNGEITDSPTVSAYTLLKIKGIL